MLITPMKRRRVTAVGPPISTPGNGETVNDAVLREKRREDLLREITGWLMIRLIWADLFKPAATAERIRKQLYRQPSRRR